MSKSSSLSPANKLIENVLSDFKLIHNDCKKKYPHLKEAIEIGIVKLRMLSSSKDHEILQGLSASSEVFTPIFLGFESKFVKIIPQCLSCLQKLATSAAIGEMYAGRVALQLSNLADDGIEELRILQTVIVLLTTSKVIQKDSLAQILVLCFKLYFSQDGTTSNTASAAIRQGIAVVIDRMMEEDKHVEDSKDEPLGTYHNKCPKTLRPRAQDAYLLFQDLCQLTNGDNPYWLQGMKTMTRTFGLELMESILRHYPKAFLDHPEFSFLLKERVCPLIIKLFSPNIKYKQGGPTTPTIIEKPIFSVSVRLLRIVSVLIKQFYTLLVTECEIFLSLLVKFLDGDKPFWQRALALEVLQSLCVQPQILRSFCQYYDMQEHSTKIFHQICEALGVFIQSLFAKEAAQVVSNSSTTNQTGGGSNSVPNSPSVDKLNQSGFLYKGAWIPVPNISKSITKPVYLEQLEYKNDGVNVSESYGMHLVFSCILEICNAIDILILKRVSKRKSTKSGDCSDSDIKHQDKTGLGSEAFKHTQPLDVDTEEDLEPVWQKMIDSCWNNMLTTLTILLEACTDEPATDMILKGLQVFASVCGQLNLNSNRDAFISCLCKMALPVNYVANNLNSLLSKQSQTYEMAAVPGVLIRDGTYEVVTTPNSIVMTVKNIQCMRGLLNMAHCHGDILGSAWYMSLVTLQHLTQILGLKLSSGGSFKTIQANELPNLVISQSMMGDLPILSSMLSRLFESSQYLDDVGVHHLVDALCRLSSEDMEQANNNKEPSLFGVAKMLETGLVNLNRLRVLWKPLTAHLLEVSQHPHSRLREWGGDALTTLIKSALFYEHNPPLTEDLSLQLMVLYPLQEMACIQYTDVRQQQFECMLNILQECAPQLANAWPVVLKIIGSATNQQNEAIIRLAFQSLQLVVTDFLPIIPCWCLQSLVNVTGKFGLQPNEINISLTAVGLLWNLSDFLYQNRTSLKHDLENYAKHQPELIKKDEHNKTSPIHNVDLYPEPDTSVPPFDAAWMSLYGKLGELCVDPRPAVRKSAGQTLFSTISAHGGLLESKTWYTVLWKVLFPLLEKVKAMSSAAADCPPPSDNTALPGNILIHHSRDTAEKQWAETCVLTLAGVSRVFSTRSHILQRLDDFPRAWALLLEIIESNSLSKNAEVSLNSLKSFQEIVVSNNKVNNGSSTNDQDNDQVSFVQVNDDELDLWINAWRVWQNIGMKAMETEHFLRTIKDNNGKIQIKTIYPSQPYLTALVNVFPPLLGRIYSRFGIGDLQRLSKVLVRAISMPLHSDTSPFLLPSFHHEAVLSPLQQSVLDVAKLLLKPLNILENKSILEHFEQQPMYPTVFELLLTFVEYACCPPKVESHDKENYTHIRGRAGEWVVMNYVPLAENSLKMIQELYKNSYSKVAVIKGNVLQHIIQTVHLPLKLKYACPAQSTWKLSIDLLLSVLHDGLHVHMSTEEGENYDKMWSSLAITLDDFLFSESPPPESQTLEQHKLDEAIDIKLLKLIRQEILPYSSCLPQSMVDQLMKLLNKGSIHSVNTSLFESDSVTFSMKEEFAKLCFETLLQFSFFKENDNGKDDTTLSKVALSSLLDRCKHVLQKYAQDERLNGCFPLPRPRMFEISFAIKAISTFLSSLKKTIETRPHIIDGTMWGEVISMYPIILECVTCSSNQVRQAIKEALLEYHDLLAPPPSTVT